MNTKVKYGVVIFFFLLAVGYLLKEMHTASHDIKENDKVINSLQKSSDENKKSAEKSRAKIEEYKKNPRAPEKILRRKYDIIRKDQFIIKELPDQPNKDRDGDYDKTY